MLVWGVTSSTSPPVSEMATLALSLYYIIIVIARRSKVKELS